MAPIIGRTLHHFEITGKLGEGGMGVVYKARDTHLDRFVALKVLPPERVSDPDRKSRFIQEAKAASALNHPGIVTIYDIHHADGIDYIAMEWVEGKTLSELIPRKGMRLMEMFTYAVQIADALAAAHAAGTVHRDLKPANIMVTEKGLVKVLDFGLAKLTEQAQGDDAASTATIDDEGRPVTQEGVIVGTVAYMSPERAEGKKVDARSDIFSLGSVLYEMVTGQKAFNGTGKVSTLSAILTREPKPISAIAPTIPSELERLISRCLRKDPQRRVQTMADLKVALDELKEDSDSGKLAAPVQAMQTGRPYPRLLMTFLAAGILAVVAWLWFGRSRPATDETVPTPVPLTAYPGSERDPSFSPDGTQVAFQWCPEGGNCDIYAKQIGVEPPSRLTDTPEDEYSPAWSPDGKFIAFLRRLPAKKRALLLIPQRGGRERILTELDASKGFRLDGPYTAWSPDSKWVATAAPDEAGTWALYLFSIETGERRRLTNPPAGVVGGDTAPAFSPNGRNLIFARWEETAELYILPLGEGFIPQGEPVRVPSQNNYSIGAAWMPDEGEIVFASGDTFSSASIGLWRAAASALGQPRRLAFATEDVHSPAISRHENRLAYAVGRGGAHIWRLDLHGPQREPGTPVEIISSTRGEDQPALSWDGKRIAFRSERSGRSQLWVCESDGANPEQLTSFKGSFAFAGGINWSPDGRNIAFNGEYEGYSDIYVVSADGGTPHRLTDGQWPYWSRDGRSIYVASNRGGSSQIWKIPVGGGNAVQISHDPDVADLPHESPDGKSVYYSKGWPNPQSVWKIPANGGEPMKVLDGVHPSALWTVAENGIYFFTAPDEKGRSDLSMYEFPTGRIRKLMTMEKPVWWHIEASGAGRTILYTQGGEGGSDLMLVENFR